jgi:hypothetical protein
MNNKIYIGVHKTEDLNDGYMGSGKVVKSAINKYGIDNFRKDILEFFENAELMYAREKDIVNHEFIMNENTYNLRRGGTGGFDYINLKKLNRNSGNVNKRNNHYEISSKGGIITRDKELGIHSEISRKKSKLSLKKKYPNGTFFNKKHSNETIEKMKSSHVGMQSGEKNSQFGTKWITNGIISKKIKKDDDIPIGWKLGRS